MAAPLLIMQDIHLTFGGTPLIVGAELIVAEADRLALVGRNGSGKSTLLKIAAGLIEADRGERTLRNGITVRYLPQEPDLSAFKSVLDYVEAGLGPGDDPYRARYLLEMLGMTGDEEPRSLSGGETRRAALARTLAPEPDILLLDEPTNHLDLPAIEWLESELAGLKSAIVLISHDRRFLEKLSRATVWLDRGKTRRLDQGFSAFEAWRDSVLEEEEVARQKLDRQIAREEDWLRYGVTARRKRNVRRLGQLHDLRRQRREAKRAVGTVKMQVSDGEVSGKRVIEAQGVWKSFGERTIVKDLAIRILRGDRLGIVGPNGAGKTTLINLLTGALAPDQGEVILGSALDMVTLDQKREALDPNTTLAETLTGGRGDTVTVGGATKHVVGYMKDFLFAPEQARTPVSVLSGGERGRLMLARALARPSNLLVLDEPTNDLDLETLDLLEEMLADYPGTVILVSHDRDFLDKCATSILFAEGDGRWTEYAGGYSDMLAQRGEGVQARKVEKARPAAEAKTAAAPAPQREARKRLTMAQQHSLKTLPGRIEILQREVKAAEARLADPALFSKDPLAFSKASQALADKQAELDAAETEWLELEMLREEIGG